MAAGLGFKDFQTGDVLTAADVDGYLMQGIWVFANAAARDAAVTSPQEGNCCYLKDTDAVQTYSGSAWVGFDDSNAIQNSIVDAKGDIVAASGNDTPARLAVGTTGSTLVADSAAATGLNYIPTFFAGKNKIINGDFGVNQRSFTSTTTTGTYGFDRWLLTASDGTTTYSAQTFTTGAAPVAGYESTNFARLVTTGQTSSTAVSMLVQRIESSRTFANQTVTFSFWAKANSGTPKIAVEFDQSFGTGGGASSAVLTYAGQVTLSTSWARYSVTVALPSISGKTIGNNDFLAANLYVSAGTSFNSRTGSLGIQTNTFDVWGIQIESGSTATSFQTASGSTGGELDLCQRYYYRNTDASGVAYQGVGQAMSTTVVDAALVLPVTLRAIPFALDISNMAVYASGATRSGGAFTLLYANKNTPTLRYTHGSAVFTSGNAAWLVGNAANCYVGLDAEI